MPAIAVKTEILPKDHPNPEANGFSLYTTQVVMETFILIVTGIQCNQIIQREFAWSEVTDALFTNPAVTTLGCDLIMCMFSYGVYLGIQRHSFPDDIPGPDDEDIFEKKTT